MNETDAAGRRTGAWEEPDPHGGTMHGEYVDGQRHGRWEHRFVDGRVRSEMTYEAGAIAGPVTWSKQSWKTSRRPRYSSTSLRA